MDNNRIQKAIFDPVQANRDKFAAQFGRQLAELFPEAVEDGTLDFRALLAELGSYADTEERYELNWAGKMNAKRIAKTDLAGKTLKYIPEESKHPETTENLYIEGDNLDVLKLLRNSYYNKIKMIYIDPPYNTGNDFVYRDSFAISSKENARNEGEVDEFGNRLTVNQRSGGRACWASLLARQS